MAERQISKRPQGVANIGGAINQAAGLFDKAAAASGQKRREIVMEQAQQEGLESALQNPNQQPKDAITSADRAFNDAYLNGSRVLLTSEGQRQISQIAHDTTKEGALDSASLSRYNQLGKSAIEGILQNTPKQNRAEVEFSLNQIFLGNQQKVAGIVDKYNHAQLVGQFQSSLESFSSGLSEAYISGDAKLGANLTQEAVNSIRVAKNANLITQNEADNLVEKVRMQSYTSHYQGLLRQAFSNGNAPEFLSQFANNPPKSLSTEQHRTIGESLLKENRFLNQMQAEQQALNYYDVINGIESGAIQDISQIDDIRSMLSTSGYNNARTKFNNVLNARADSRESVDGFLNAATQKDYQAVIGYDNKTVNAGFNYALQIEQERIKRQRVATGQMSEDDPLPSLGLKEQAAIASQLMVSVPDFNQRLAAAVELSAPMNAKLEAIAAFDYLSENNPSYLRNLSRGAFDDLNVLSMLSRNALSTGEEGIENAIARFERIKDISPQVRNERETRYKDITRGKSMDDYALEVGSSFFGSIRWSKNSRLSKVPPGLADEYRRLMEINYMAYGDEETAKRLAIEQISQVWGKDTSSGSEKLILAPPAKVVPGYEENPIFTKNSFVRSIYEMVDEFNALPDELKNYESVEVSVTGSSFREDIKDVFGIGGDGEFERFSRKTIGEFNDYDMLNESFLRPGEELKVVVNGKPARVYLDSNAGGLSELDPLKMQWTVMLDFEDGSIPQPFYPMINNPAANTYVPDNIFDAMEAQKDSNEYKIKQERAIRRAETAKQTRAMIEWHKQSFPSFSGVPEDFLEF